MTYTDITMSLLSLVEYGAQDYRLVDWKHMKSPIEKRPELRRLKSRAGPVADTILKFISSQWDIDLALKEIENVQDELGMDNWDEAALLYMEHDGRFLDAITDGAESARQPERAYVVNKASLK